MHDLIELEVLRLHYQAYFLRVWCGNWLSWTLIIKRTRTSLFRFCSLELLLSTFNDIAQSVTGSARSATARRNFA